MSISNQKALNIVNRYKNIIYSYLEAVPPFLDPAKIKTNNILDSSKKEEYIKEKQSEYEDQWKYVNSISTVPMTSRTEENGYANFKFTYNEQVRPDYYQARTLNVRVETAIGFSSTNYHNILSINSSKVKVIVNADLLIFARDDANGTLYLSFREDCNNGNTGNNWLNDISNRTKEYVSGPNGKIRAYYTYDLQSLWEQGKLIKIYQDSVLLNEKKIAILHNDYITKSGDSVNTYKNYIDYNIDTSHIKEVQYDRRSADTCFWGYRNSLYTSNDGTLPGIVNGWKEIFDPSENVGNVYQRLYNALDKTLKTDVAHCCKIKVDMKKVNCMFDPNIFNEKGELEIYISNNPDFNIQENKKVNKTSDMKTYQKTYQKVVMYLKRHDNAYNPKWTEEEKAIADKYLTK